MKLQFLFTILLIALVAVFAKDATVGSAAPVAAAAPAVEASPVFQKLVKTSDDTVSKVKALAAEVASLKQNLATLTKEMTELKATLQQLSSTDASLFSRVTKLDEIVAAFNTKIEAIKADNPSFNKFITDVKDAAQRYYAVGKVYAIKAAVAFEEKAGPALKDVRAKVVKAWEEGSVKSCKYSETLVAEATVLFKKARADLTVFLLGKGVPSDKAPFAALAIIATVVLIALFIAFTILFKILGLVFRVLCCCCISKPRKAAAAAATAGHNGKGHTARK